MMRNSRTPVALKRPRNFKDVFKKFFANSTIRGVPKIMREVNPLWKAIWIISVLSFLSIAGYFVTQSVLAYMNYQQTMTEEIPDKGQNYFPPITICDVREYSVKAPNMWKKFVKEKLAGIDAFFQNATDLIKGNPETVDLTAEEEKPLIIKIEFVKYLESKNISFEVLDKHFIFKCQFHRPGLFGPVEMNCKIDKYRLADKSPCYKITLYKRDWRDVREETKLEVVVYLDDAVGVTQAEQVNDDGTKKSGAKVYIHSEAPLSLAQALQNGDGLEVGLSRAMHIKGLVQHRLKTPKSTCENEINEVTLSNGEKHLYTQRRCNELQLQSNVINGCKCRWRQIAVPEGYNTDEISPCLEFDKGPFYYYTNILCAINPKIFSGSKIKCIEPCQSERYHAIKWFRPWPSGVEAIALFNKHIRNTSLSPKFAIYERAANVYKKNRIKGLNMINNITLIKRNFARLSTKMSLVDLRIIKYDLLDTWVSVLSKVGGQLSLWVGLTFIAGIEIIQLFYDLLRVLFDKILKVGKHDHMNNCNTEAMPV